ncbi:short-chain dehydrogenase/reductase [Candidatus Poriferisodalis sp.]|uniref:short-chain dehydrogenase/reductase n=1 Tax=Candidatus Poriferisodalis sp. TaxID=3101277 RepID=UPI003B01867B
MDLGLAGKRAVITGASKGIGLGCAVALAREGCHVALAARSADVLATAAEEVQAAAPKASVTTHAVDLSTTQGRRALLAETGCDGEAAVGGLVDIWVNNAGAIPGGDIVTVDDTRWRDAWDLKVFGYIELCRAVLPQMSARGSGVIVNVIGAASLRPQPSYIAGAVGNSGLVAMTAALGSRSLREGVRVVAVNPGLIITDRMGDLLRRQAVDEWGDESRWEELIPVDPAPGTVEQVADVVAFLASDRAGHVSGTSITIDGGATAR